MNTHQLTEIFVLECEVLFAKVDNSMLLLLSDLTSWNVCNELFE